MFGHMQRRAFLQTMTVTTVAMVNGEIWRTLDQAPPPYGEGPAFEPWKTWHQESKQGPLALVRAAILSSNAYNSQPWLFRVSATQIEIYADVRRNLGAFDPYCREMHFSLGCALENLLVAAPVNSYKTSVTLQPGKLEPPPPQPEPKLIARVMLAPGTSKSAMRELYEAIPNRHTNREPFHPEKAVPPDFVAALKRAASGDSDLRLFLFSDAAQRKKLVDAITASSSFLADPEVQRGVRPWFRTTLEELQKSPDGAYVGPGGPSKPSSLEQYKAIMMSAPLFGVIAVRDRYDIPQTVRAGQLWQRAHLLATARGLAARPANGAVEIIDHERRLQQPPTTMARLAEIIGEPVWQPTFMFYMGYATQPALPSARRSVDDVLAG